MLIFHNIYALSLNLVYEIIFFTLVLWILLGVLVRKSVKLQRMWQLINVVLFVVSVIGILGFTLISRNGESADKLPFIRTFEMIKKQPELIREMIMNAFLFFPLGLTLSYALSCVLPCEPCELKNKKTGSMVNESSESSFAMVSDMSSEMLCQKKGEKNEKQNSNAVKVGSKKRKNYRVVSVVFITIAAALVLSCTIEFIQHSCSFGSPELSDIIMNTLGAVIGSLAFVVNGIR